MSTSDIDKHVVLVVSGGRTATTFLGELLDQIIQDSYSVHEPDLFDGLNRKTWERIRRFGLYHMIFGRLAGRTGIRNLTQRYLSGRLSLEGLVEEILRHRKSYFDSIDSDLIIESYYQWYGLLPGATLAFPRLRVAAVVRDPRPWVESWLALGAHHGHKDHLTRWGFRRLNPRMVDDFEFVERWPRMTSFEKNCWDWRIVYGLITKWVDDHSCAQLFRFSDLFLSDERNRHFRKLLQFITTFPDRRFEYLFDPSILRLQKNQAQDAPASETARSWTTWSTERASLLDDICGDLMRELGYGHEPEWLKLLDDAE